jgi:hypothetical protein
VRIALVAGGLGILALWWFDTSAGSVHGSGAAVTAAGRVSGLLAAYLVLVELLLMARLPGVGTARWTRRVWSRAGPPTPPRGR